MSAAETFAQSFLTRLLALANDTLDQGWRDQDRAMFRAKVFNLARREAAAAGVHPDAADAIATYALATMTLDGLRLEDATVENLRRGPR